jgi:hypothetical protein
MASSRLNSMEFWALCGINATISMSDFGRKLKAARMQHQALQRKWEIFDNRLPEYQQERAASTSVANPIWIAPSLKN